MNNSESWAKDSRCYELLMVVNDMNDSKSLVRALDAMNSPGL